MDDPRELIGEDKQSLLDLLSNQQEILLFEILRSTNLQPVMDETESRLQSCRTVVSTGVPKSGAEQ